MNTRTLLRNVGVMMATGTLVLSTVAFAQTGAGREGRHEGKMERLEKVAEELNLTADQKAKIKAYREQFKKDNAAALQEIKTLRDQMKQAIKDKNKEQAQTIGQQLKTKMQALRDAHQNLMTQIKGVLTPEQQAKLETIKANRKEHRKELKEERKERRKERRQNGIQQREKQDIR